jgi:hypothetical protein
VYVSCHARLNYPAPWNSQASKASPCGGGSAPQTPVATWKANQRVYFTWTVIAGDGTGAVTVRIDPAGGQSFSITPTVDGLVPNAVRTFNMSFVVPNINCTRCTIQAFSTTNWFSCSTVTIENNPPPAPAPVSDTCVTPTSLSFCSNVVGKKVLLPSGVKDIQTHDNSTRASFEANLANPLVFKTPNNTGCRDAYKKLICGLSYQDCDRKLKPGCNQACVATMSLCGLDESHFSLYNCTAITNTVEDMSGMCNSATKVSWTIALLFVVLATFI